MRMTTTKHLVCAASVMGLWFTVQVTLDWLFDCADFVKALIIITV